MQSSEYVSIEEVAEAYGVTGATVRFWCRTGAIQGAIRAGRQWRIPKRYATGGVSIDLEKAKGENNHEQTRL